MPKDLVIQEIEKFIEENGAGVFEESLDNGKDLISNLAKSFQVSPMTMTLRLQNLGILSGF